MNEQKRLSVGDIADPFIIKKLWQKTVRKRLRELRFPDFELAQDPLDCASYDWNIEQFTEALADQLRSGTYLAQRPTIIRAAKRQGLTRPLAFLSVPDALAYKAVISRSESSLVSASRSFSRLGRSDPKQKRDDSESAYVGWFVAWLKRQGQIWVMAKDFDWLIETDIANFFPYVSVPAVLEHMYANSVLSKEAVLLLGYMLREFAPRVDYRVSEGMGLPQENYDCSRIIGHTYLNVVDEDFLKEGSEGRYSRFVDDIIVGAQDHKEATLIIARVQKSLEKIGLYPNTAKTKIYRRSEFAKEYMQEENDFLGSIEDACDAKMPVDLGSFDERLKLHLHAPQPRPLAWLRVLRRYYTLSKRVRNARLLNHAFGHMKSHPDASRHIFEYLVTFGITEKRLSGLIAALNSMGGVYPDLEILAMEYLATAPNLQRKNLRKLITNWSQELASEASDRRPFLTASANIVTAKFGEAADIERLLEQLKSGWKDLPSHLTALTILAANGTLTHDEVRNYSLHAGTPYAPHLRYIDALFSKEAKAVNVAFGRLEAVRRRYPARAILRPRALVLAPLLATSQPVRWNKWATTRLTAQMTQPMYLRDRAVERILATGKLGQLDTS